MKSYLYHNRPHDIRRGFTVVEVLVAITIIAILAAILTPVVGSALRRANEFAIESEMSQLDLAIEHFKSDNGFYPPSFQRINGASDFLPYLNRIAPNHSYTQAQVTLWCDSVGTEIKNTPGADLVFWLSGIAKNKQYPLGLEGNWIAGHDAIDDGVERNAYFEFSVDRLDTPTAVATSYIQARGPEEPYRYIDAGSYGATNLNQSLATFHGYHVIGPAGREFFNPKSFQLVCFGLDGKSGGPFDNQGNPQNYSDQPGKEYACTGLVTAWNQSIMSPRNALNPTTGAYHPGSGLDNITNFVGEGVGKLETTALGID